MSTIAPSLKSNVRSTGLLTYIYWQFLISTWAARNYAELRLSERYEDFKRLASMADKKIKGEAIESGEWQLFEDCKKRDRLFDELDIDWFAGVEFPA